METTTIKYKDSDGIQECVVSAVGNAFCNQLTVCVNGSVINLITTGGHLPNRCVTIANPDSEVIVKNWVGKISDDEHNAKNVKESMDLFDSEIPKEVLKNKKYDRFLGKKRTS